MQAAIRAFFQQKLGQVRTRHKVVLLWFVGQLSILLLLVGDLVLDRDQVWLCIPRLWGRLNTGSTLRLLIGVDVVPGLLLVASQLLLRLLLLFNFLAKLLLGSAFLAGYLLAAQVVLARVDRVLAVGHREYGLLRRRQLLLLLGVLVCAADTGSWFRWFSAAHVFRVLVLVQCWLVVFKLLLLTELSLSLDQFFNLRLPQIIEPRTG